MTTLPRNTILTGDALTILRELPTATVDCVTTSPPYFQLRDYGVNGQLGLEPTVHSWVANLRQVCTELVRVLKPSACLWLNLGDSYSRHPRLGAPPKSLLLTPERLLLALVQDGWIVRNRVVWAKPNAMPTSVSDRLATMHESVFLLVRSRRYFFDLDAIREVHRSKVTKPTPATSAIPRAWVGPLAGTNTGLRQAKADGRVGHLHGRNPGDVWTIPTRPFRGAHFATFPPQLLRRPILATCPRTVCTACGAGFRSRADAPRPCSCNAPTRPGVVLDPFFGAGTVGLVAREHGRDWLGIELNPAFVRLAEERLAEARGGPDALAA